MTAVSVRTRLPMPHPTITVRVAMTFAALFLVAGAGLLALNYALLQDSLQAGHAGQVVPSYPAAEIISRARALIGNPQASALDKAAAQAELAVAERHPHARLAGGLLPQLVGDSAIEAAEARTFDAVLRQLIRQSALILAPLAVLAVASGWLVARRMPLAIMRTELDVTLDQRRPSLAELHAMGDVVRSAITRSDRLVAGLLALAESERGLEHAEPVELSALAGPALALVADSARAAGISLTTNLAPAPVTGTPVLLERLVENLADNAVRHNQPGGWLTITTARHGDTAQLTVESSGPCITSGQAATLFEPFRRLHADRVNSARGSGLGLSIVRAIARAHGGDATATPLAPGGLRVTVTLPARPSTAGSCTG